MLKETALEEARPFLGLTLLSVSVCVCVGPSLVRYVAMPMYSLDDPTLLVGALLVGDVVNGKTPICSLTTNVRHTHRTPHTHTHRTPHSQHTHTEDNETWEK